MFAPISSQMTKYQDGHRPGLLASLAHQVSVWRTRSRERQRLALFDNRELNELGVSRWEVEHELAKHFWEG